MEEVLDQCLSVEYTDVFLGISGDTSKNAYLQHEYWTLDSYQQVFSYDKPFTPNLSMIDLLLNEGPVLQKVDFSDRRLVRDRFRLEQFVPISPESLLDSSSFHW